MLARISAAVLTAPVLVFLTAGLLHLNYTPHATGLGLAIGFAAAVFVWTANTGRRAWSRAFFLAGVCVAAIPVASALRAAQQETGIDAVGQGAISLVLAVFAVFIVSILWAAAYALGRRL